MKASILVPDAHARAPIAAIRSLGRAGYDVHAISPRSDALGLKSSFANQARVHPLFGSPEFLDWIRAYVARHHIRMIVPSTGILFALRPVFTEFKPLLPIMEDIEALYRCFDKTAVVQDFMAADPALGLMNHHPRSAVIDLSRDFSAALLPPSHTGYYVKAEGPRGRAPADLAHDINGFAVAKDTEAALWALGQMADSWEKALVQESCQGVQVGVSLLMSKGQALAVSSVRDCHPLPHSRGTMSLRESCRLPEVEADAIRRLAYLQWEGCAMAEYRFDESTGDFNLIEINFRYWQYLHLDLWADMDFPLMQAEWFLEGRTEFSNVPVEGVICRDSWPGEVAQITSELRRSDLAVMDKVAAIIMFFARFLNPRIHQDLSFPGDRMLYWRGFLSYLREEVRALPSKFARNTRAMANEDIKKHGRA